MTNSVILFSFEQMAGFIILSAMEEITSIKNRVFCDAVFYFFVLIFLVFDIRFFVLFYRCVMV